MAEISKELLSQLDSLLGNTKLDDVTSDSSGFLAS